MTEPEDNPYAAPAADIGGAEPPAVGWSHRLAGALFLIKAAAFTVPLVAVLPGWRKSLLTVGLDILAGVLLLGWGARFKRLALARVGLEVVIGAAVAIHEGWIWRFLDDAFWATAAALLLVGKPRLARTVVGSSMAVFYVLRRVLSAVAVLKGWR